MFKDKENDRKMKAKAEEGIREGRLPKKKIMANKVILIKTLMKRLIKTYSAACYISLLACL